MALTVKKLKEFLRILGDDIIITSEQNEDFVHMIAGNPTILSTKQPIGYCNRTDEYVYPSVVEGYSAFSPELDEDLYAMEWTPFTKSSKERREECQ